MMKQRKYQPLISSNVIWAKDNKKSLNNGEVSIQPLEPGFGNTFGNSLRRILLGGIEGSAVTSVIIEGVNNECSVVYGCIEDTMNIILNIKELVIKNETGEPGEMILRKSQKGPVLASDIECDSHLSIVNKDHLIATLAEDGNLNIRFFVTSGRGYLPAEWPKNESLQSDGKIYIDATFAPVRNVSLDVKKASVGDNIDYDELVLNITTDGTITPKEAFEYSVSVALNQFENFLIEKENNIKFTNYEKNDIKSYATENLIKEYVFSENEIEKRKNAEEKGNQEIDSALAELLLKSIDVLGLPARAHNCLLSSGIQRVIDLVNMTEQEAIAIKNFGRKSYDDLYQTMKDFGISFNMKINEKNLLNNMEKKS